MRFQLYLVESKHVGASAPMKIWNYGYHFQQLSKIDQKKKNNDNDKTQKTNFLFESHKNKNGKKVVHLRRSKARKKNNRLWVEVHLSFGYRFQLHLWTTLWQACAPHMRCNAIGGAFVWALYLTLILRSNTMTKWVI